ncbi:hypothetical protein HNP84_004716 [Thermocatellispora tengchongensis]|uniref:Uncharacterized protein n=1 Tax=Thermocatellispora tengchongensis TaxID=1073253 RepID=A0A840P6N1_9ACTN|nr:hypothetical protein [Thermocatellispora tengchongensis]MBB5134982.1 hypothetical protein [Thermocatellispora tengchongensis]
MARRDGPARHKERFGAFGERGLHFICHGRRTGGFFRLENPRREDA